MYEADRALVTRMRAGEQRAFDEFYQAHADRLAAFAARRSGLDSASVEDIVQNTLVKAIRNLSGFRGEAALFTWLANICRNELADAHRKGLRRPQHESLEGTVATEVAELRIPPELEPSAELEALEQRRAIVQILDTLPSTYALALEAKYGDGLTVNELACLLDLTPVAAQSLLARAKGAFRIAWQKRANEMTVEERSP